jgi:hypothetical protein
MMGAFAAYVVWTLVRALRDGVIFSDGIGSYPRTADEVRLDGGSARHGRVVVCLAGRTQQHRDPSSSRFAALICGGPLGSLLFRFRDSIRLIRNKLRDLR